jgi:hypothetical protein
MYLSSYKLSQYYLIYYTILLKFKSLGLINLEYFYRLLTGKPDSTQTSDNNCAENECRVKILEIGRLTFFYKHCIIKT